jgi:probable F420-dependent oxidoreductase
LAHRATRAAGIVVAAIAGQRYGAGVRFGVMTPIVSRNPRHDPPAWEADGTIEDLAVIAAAAENLGYDFLTFPEHVAVPVDVAPVRGGTYWAPLPTMGYLAARTTRLRLATYVLVLGYHHPVELAKSYGTLDRICGGRLVLGLGVGSLRPEFELLGVPFEGRGERADDALRALRAAFAADQPVYHGPHYDVEGFVVAPSGLDRHLPVWIGGRTSRSLRRAAALGDGWAPFGLPPATVRDLLARHPPTAPLRPAGSAPLDVILAPEPPVNPITDAEAVRATVQRYEDAGATHLVFRFRQASRAELLDQMAALMELCPAARQP